MTDGASLNLRACELIEDQDWDGLLELAAFAADAGDTEGAITVLELAAEAGSARSSHNLGVYADEAGDCEAAVMHFRRAVALGNAESRVNLGLALEKSGQTSEARKVYEEAVALGSDGAMVDLGLLLLSQGDVDASLRVLEGAADLDSRWAWQLGDAYLAASEDESAASAYRRAISAGEKRAARDLAKLIDPADETTVRQLYVMSIEAGAVAAIAEYVEYLTARGHFAEAEEISLAAIRQGDSYVPLAYARLLATSHRYPEARAMYTRAASLGDDVSDEVGELA